MSDLLSRLRQARARMEASQAAPVPESTFRLTRGTVDDIAPALSSLSSLSSLVGRDLDRATVAVLDLETTGLHGAGTVPFVIGLALASPAGVEVLQWTLHTMGGERAMLACLLETLERRAPDHLLTYNGSSFDRPLLQRRLIRHRLESNAIMIPHTDVLVVVRRLLRDRFGDCRLATMEAALLGVERRGDIASAEIPAVFFDALRAPNNPRARERLARVVRHNRQDVLSTLGLVAPLGALLEAPRDDWEAVRGARHFVREQRPACALRVLRRFDPRAGPVGAADSAGFAGAHLLAEVLRQSGSLDEAARVWQAIADAAPGDPVAHERLAKHYEHRRGDPSAALRYASGSAAACSHRIERLQRKVSRLDGACKPQPSPA